MAAVPVSALAGDRHEGRHEFRGGHERFEHGPFFGFGFFPAPFYAAPYYAYAPAGLRLAAGLLGEPALRGRLGPLHLRAAVGAGAMGLPVGTTTPGA
jgi:hypothetical protein